MATILVIKNELTHLEEGDEIVVKVVNVGPVSRLVGVDVVSLNGIEIKET